MGGDGQSPEELKNSRNVPAIAKEEKISPEAPSSGLSNYEKCFRRPEADPPMKNAGHRWISRKEGDIRNLHCLACDGRKNGLVSAVHDVRKPVAVVLDQRCVAIGKRTRRGDQNYGHE